MKSTFIRDDGTRLHVEPSHAFKVIRIWVPGEAEIVSIPAELAQAVAGAIVGAQLELHHAEVMAGAEGG